MNIRFLFSIGLLLNVFVTYRLYDMTRADLVNSYLFMWPDSFDWIANGIYYLERFGYHLVGEMPTVRQPAFPLLIAFVFLLGVPKLLIFFGQIAFCCTLFCSYKLFRVLRVRGELATVGLLILFLDHSFNSFRAFLMADVYAVASLTAATLLFVLGTQREKRQYLILAGVVCGVGSLFQLYGLFPCIAFVFSSLVMSRKPLFRDAIIPMLIAFSFQLSWTIVKYLLFGSPEAGGVKQFSLLNVGFENYIFYSDVWPKVYLPLLPCILLFLPLLKYASLKWDRLFPVFFLFVLNGMFFVALFFYQWHEARFTYYFYPLTIVFVLTALSECFRDAEFLRKPIFRVVFILSTLATAYLALVPSGNIMQPTLETHIADVKNIPRTFRKNFFSFLLRHHSVSHLYDGCVVHRPKKKKRPRVRKGCYQYKYKNIVRYLNFRARERERAQPG